MHATLSFHNMPETKGFNAPHPALVNSHRTMTLTDLSLVKIAHLKNTSAHRKLTLFPFLPPIQVYLINTDLEVGSVTVEAATPPPEKSEKQEEDHDYGNSYSNPFQTK